MATGKSNAAIASALVLSERAVEKHINSIFSKLHLVEEPDVNRRVKAVLLYLGAGEASHTPRMGSSRFPAAWASVILRAVEPRGENGSAVNVLVVDDQPPFRAAARAVIDRVPGFSLVGESDLASRR